MLMCGVCHLGARRDGAGYICVPCECGSHYFVMVPDLVPVARLTSEHPEPMVTTDQAEELSRWYRK